MSDETELIDLFTYLLAYRQTDRRTNIIAIAGRFVLMNASCAKLIFQCYNRMLQTA